MTREKSVWEMEHRSTSYSPTLYPDRPYLIVCNLVRDSSRYVELAMTAEDVVRLAKSLLEKVGSHDPEVVYGHTEQSPDSESV